MALFIGCPVWSFKGWVGNFYPKGAKPADYLREYASRLTTVEGNTTFYAVPSQKTIEGWRAQMPATFRFCPKIPKAISHAGRLSGRLPAAVEFATLMNQFGSRLGPMFLQLPPSYSPEQFEDLKEFLRGWPREIRLGVEVRHLDWFETPWRESLNQTLSGLGMARVVIDTRPIRSLDGDKILAGSVYQTLLQARERKPNVPSLLERTADFIFLRLIGHPQMELNRPFLEEWGSTLAAQLADGADAFVFCHSPDTLTCPSICRELYRQISKSISLPRLPWDEAGSSTFEQGQLL